MELSRHRQVQLVRAESLSFSSPANFYPDGEGAWRQPGEKRSFRLLKFARACAQLQGRGRDIEDSDRRVQVQPGHLAQRELGELLV